jgi:hypothetical protein
MPRGEPTHALRFAIQLAEAEGYAECAAGLRTALAHLERTQWRPIEEAPKDGTPVLVFAAPFVFTAERHKGSWYALIGDEIPGSEDTSVLLDEVTRWGDPTHWMPLPPSPETP